jgi:hypothetical protein
VQGKCLTFNPYASCFHDLVLNLIFCQEKGIDYETAVAATKAETEKRFAAYLKDKEEKKANFSMEKYFALKEELFEMEQIAFEMAIRKDDNEKQKLKGQPSLDDEDTGAQYRNDPEE